MRSAARRSPRARPRSASTTPTSVSSGKLWPLATSCVPMTMSTSPLAIACELERAAAARPPAMSLDRTMRARLGKALPRPPRRAARRPARPATRLSVVAAVRAGLGPRLGVAAMVAEEHAAEAVLDQPGRAVRALEAVAAGAAERQRRVAAAIEEEERLLLLGERLGDRRDERRRQKAAALGLVAREGRSP